MSEPATGFRELLRAASPVEAAELVLGSTLARGPVRLEILEVEAYGGPPGGLHEDPAAHSRPGPTARNAVLFGDAGHLYVYLSHGLHVCLNVSCGTEGNAGGVLLRAGRVTAGHELVAARRPGVPEPRWARGPGNLGRAMGADLADRGTDLLDPASEIRLLPTAEPGPVSRGPRVGVSRAADRPWRLWTTGAVEVSAYRRSPRAGPTRPRTPGRTHLQ